MESMGLAYYAERLNLGEEVLSFGTMTLDQSSFFTAEEKEAIQWVIGKHADVFLNAAFEKRPFIHPFTHNWFLKTFLVYLIRKWSKM